MRLCVDVNITEAIELWIKHGIPAGSCTELLLRGRYDEAFLHAHPHIKPHWLDHIEYIESLPIECRNENYESWRGVEYEKCKIKLDKELFKI